LDSESEPCDNFYQFACGGFLSEIYTPDEKSIVSTKSIAQDKIHENLLKVISKPISEYEDGVAKKLFKNCMNIDAIEERGKEPLNNLLDEIGNCPMLNMEKWNENKWNWQKVISIFRDKFMKDEGIFAEDTYFTFDITEPNALSKLTIKIPSNSFESNLILLYKSLVKDTVKSLFGDSWNHDKEDDLNEQINELLDFEFKLRYVRKVSLHSFPNNTSLFLLFLVPRPI
jgi:membrane metallo-endopeptidase-like protein 1